VRRKKDRKEGTAKMHLAQDNDVGGGKKERRQFGKSFLQGESCARKRERPEDGGGERKSHLYH